MPIVVASERDPLYFRTKKLIIAKQRISSNSNERTSSFEFIPMNEIYMKIANCSIYCTWSFDPIKEEKKDFRKKYENLFEIDACAMCFGNAVVAGKFSIVNIIFLSVIGIGWIDKTVQMTLTCSLNKNADLLSASNSRN